MSSKTRIIVLHMKEIIYTAVFLALAVVLAVILFFMFGPGKAASHTAGEKSRYKPGVYTSSITLNDNTFDVEVTVNADKIKAIRLVNLSETTKASYPLMEPVLNSLASQIYSSQSLEDIQYAGDRKYTSQVLLSAITDAVKKRRTHKLSAFYHVR